MGKVTQEYAMQMKAVNPTEYDEFGKELEAHIKRARYEIDLKRRITVKSMWADRVGYISIYRYEIALRQRLEAHHPDLKLTQNPQLKSPLNGVQLVLVLPKAKLPKARK